MPARQPVHPPAVSGEGLPQRARGVRPHRGKVTRVVEGGPQPDPSVVADVTGGEQDLDGLPRLLAALLGVDPVHAVARGVAGAGVAPHGVVLSEMTQHGEVRLPG